MQGTYRPYGTRKHSIPKASGTGFRQLSIGNIFDRVVAKALHTAMEPILDPLFLPRSYGFRRGKNTWHLLADLEATMIRTNHSVLAVDDVRSAFDNVSIDDVLAGHRQLLGHRFQDAEAVERIVELLERVVQGEDAGRQVGIDLGSPYSPLALNVVLHFAHDVPLFENSKSPSWFRYADNIVYLWQDVPQGHQTLRHAQGLLKLHGLHLKGASVATPDSGGISLLGFRLRRWAGRLDYALDEAAWRALQETLESAHASADPLGTARAILHGWINAYGPAFRKAESYAARLLDVAATCGFREGISLADLQARMKTARGRWRRLQTAI